MKDLYLYPVRSSRQKRGSRFRGFISNGVYRDIASSSADAIRGVQEERLKQHLDYCLKHSPYYRRILKNEDVNLGLDGLSQLPFTQKSDIEKCNDDFCAVSLEKIRDIVLSSGTTGKPTKVMYTEYDLKRLAYNEEKAFIACGITSEDIALLTCTLDRCFVAGLAYFLGMRALGAAAIRNGHGTLESYAQVIERMNPTVIVGVPTFLRKLGLYLMDKNINPTQMSVSKLICIGEPLRDKKLRSLKVNRDLEDIWQAKTFSTYASSETVTTFCECIYQAGGHLHPDLAIVEIIDDKDRPAPTGTVGEIVLTPLAVEGMPLIRFKTQDVSFLIDKPCACGRNSLRLGPILGRKNEMMKVRGTTLYPQAIYSALEEIEGISDYFITVTKESDLSENIRISVALKDKTCGVGFIQDVLQARLRVKPEIEIKDHQWVKEQVYTVESRKPVRFLDKR